MKSIDDFELRELNQVNLQGYMSVPLVLSSQNLVSRIKKLKFNNHIESLITEGVGVFSFGFGSDVNGKSSLLNHLILPVEMWQQKDG